MVAKQGAGAGGSDDGIERCSSGRTRIVVRTDVDNAIAEWRVDADHTGALEVADDAVIEPTGRHIVLAGATFAEFRGDQICAFRTYFDDAALIEQLLISA